MADSPTPDVANLASRTSSTAGSEVPAYALALGALPAASVEKILGGRRMRRVRDLIASQQAQCRAYLLNWRPGHPDSRPEILAILTSLDEALAEVEAAELGCGGEDGECLCPCHAGVRHPHAIPTPLPDTGAVTEAGQPR